jgi:PAS domain S-box-containing protein
MMNQKGFEDEARTGNAARTRPSGLAKTAPPDEAGRDGARRTEAAFRVLVDRSAELVLVHRDDRIVYINAATLRALGYDTREELLERSYLGDVVHPLDRDVAARRGVDAQVARASMPPMPMRWLCKAGGVRTTDAVAMVADFEGEPATLVLARDVTEHSTMQAKLVATDRMAALGTLAAGVAHEINNPLTYLLVDLEQVLRRLRAAAASDDPAAALAEQDLVSYIRPLARAVEGANRVRQIVRDLQTFSRGDIEHRGLVDVRGVVESAIQMASHEIRLRARLLKRLSEVPPVEANEARLGHVFLALLVNAAQAIADGHADDNEVRVATRTDDEGNAVIEVEDTGAGIAPESLPRIFDPFFTTKAAGTGTGLGLSVAQGTIQQLGGDLQAFSTPGKGSVFRVVLPAARSHRRPSSSQMRAVLPRRRVLIIDHEPLVRESIAEALAADVDVTTAGDAREGLQLIVSEDQPFDLVLCDLLMPAMTGMDLYLEVVRAAPPIASRIVFMTSGVFTPRAKAFLENLSNPCLEKPLRIDKLRSLLARA